jgi:hypothetical protein
VAKIPTKINSDTDFFILFRLKFIAKIDEKPLENIVIDGKILTWVP